MRRIVAGVAAKFNSDEFWRLPRHADDHRPFADAAQLLTDDAGRSSQ
jgi:hypothetical protein